MRIPISRAIQLAAIGLSAAIAAPLVQSGSAWAQPIIGLNKTVAVGTSTYMTAQNAAPGDTLQYRIAYSNTGSVAAAPLTIQDTLTGGQTLQYYSSNCSASNTNPVVVTCTVANLPTNGNGVVYIGTSVNTGFAGTITNTANASTTVAGTTYLANSNTTTVTVNATPPPAPSISLQKFVSDVSRNTPYSTSISAVVGDTLLYALQFNNNSGAYLPSVTISDTLAAGQAYIYGQYYGNACNTYNQSTATVTCTLTNVPPGTSTVYVETGVQNGATTISNQASATAGTTTVYSNPTYVTVGGSTQYFTGNFTICGIVTSYVPATTYGTGSMGFFGQSYPLSVGTVMSGQPITIGEDACFTFTVNTQGQVVAVNVTPNLSGVNIVCGLYGGTGTGTSIVLSGYTFGYNGTFVPLLSVGYYYCFVVDNSGTAYILLSTIPTGIEAPHFAHAHSMRTPIEE